MKERLGIARALVGQPAILLLDEPTGVLDPVTTGTISHLVRKLQRELGVTSVLVTHDISSAFRVADRVALLHDGRIVFDGTPDEMTRSDHPYVKEFLGDEAEVYP
jgi:phospholipid/cholesterol/gamma-HCH transport system ATP-binding protein